MKIFFIILLSFTVVLSDDSISNVNDRNQILLSEDNDIGCKAVFIKKDKTNCNRSKTKKITIAPIKITNQESKKTAEIENQLNIMRKEFAEYKKIKELETEIISAKLEDITNELNQYKSNEKKKIRIRKRKLITAKKLAKNKKKLVSVKNKKVLKKSKKKEKLDPTPIYIPTTKNISWVEIKVEYGYTIYELAQKYYGDKEEYKQIYAANRNIIGKNLKLKNGMVLKIPVTAKFEDQPQILGWN